MRKEVDMRSAKIAILKTTAIFLLLISMLYSVYAAGVATVYWGYGYAGSIYVEPGKSADIAFELQNMGATDDMNIKVILLNGTEVARILDDSDVYLVKANTYDTRVNIRISVPADALMGKIYPLDISLNSITAGGGGMVALGVGWGSHINVIAGKPPEGETISQKKEICDNSIDDDTDGLVDCRDEDCKENEACKKPSSLYWIAGIIVVVLIFLILYLMGKKKEI